MSVTLGERALYHQIHPAKLATDILVSVDSDSARMMRSASASSRSTAMSADVSMTIIAASRNHHTR